jgi:thiol-disulfide isomerase/thioredoxin
MNFLHRVQRLLLCVAATLVFQAAHAQPKVGDPAPTALGRSRSADDVNLTEFQGKVVAVTFWASWCGPCQRELPLLEKLQKAVGTDRLRVVAVNIEERQLFRVATRGMSDWSIVIANDPWKERAASYGVNGIPHMVIISRDGVIRQVFRGYSEEKVPTIVEAVVAALNE